MFVNFPKRSQFLETANIVVKSIVILTLKSLILRTFVLLFTFLIICFFIFQIRTASLIKHTISFTKYEFEYLLKRSICNEIEVYNVIM